MEQFSTEKKQQISYKIRYFYVDSSILKTSPKNEFWDNYCGIVQLGNNGNNRKRRVLKEIPTENFKPESSPNTGMIGDFLLLSSFSVLSIPVSRICFAAGEAAKSLSFL